MKWHFPFYFCVCHGQKLSGCVSRLLLSQDLEFGGNFKRQMGGKKIVRLGLLEVVFPLYHLPFL
jgi:hypothetical protein